MHTYYTYFSGGDGAGVGLAAAGYTHAGGVEHDPHIAAVAASNGHPLTVADVRHVDPARLLSKAPSWFHASPACTRASRANSDGKEAPEDRETAEAVCRFIRYWLPPVVSLENVYGYRVFDSFKSICQALADCGYSYEYWHLNSADYGVPQTRRRLILLARRGAWRIQRPEPTHRKGGGLWAIPWRGWYEAIEDLLPTLPASQFVPWQLKRIPPAYLTHSCAWIVDGENAGGDRLTIREQGEPSYTVNAHDFPRRAQLTTGRVVAMNPRALARFQSFPDSYVLPDKTSLACTVIGNAVPPLLMQRIAESIR